MKTESLSFKAGLGMLGLCLLALWVFETRFADLRETVLDWGLSGQAAAPTGQVVVVAIDEDTLTKKGRWPWPRARLAQVIDRVAGAAPAVIGVDLVLSGADPAGKVALADIADEATLAALPDGDAALQRALDKTPTVLGLALADHEQPVLKLAPLLVTGPPVTASPWTANGLEGPTHLTAKGLGVAALRGDAAGTVRRAPLLIVAGDAVAPGFAAEVLRLAKSATAFRLNEGNVLIGDIPLPLGPGAELRIRPSDPALWDQRTIPFSLLEGGDTTALRRLSGKIVLLGLTAPQAAALRRTAVTPVAPSVQIQADAIETMLTGPVLQRPRHALIMEWGAAVAIGVLALTATAALGPGAAAGSVMALAMVWGGIATAAWLRFGVAIDPVMPAVPGLAAGGLAIMTSIVLARQRARAVQRRFERHLSPAVVARISSQPGLLRLPGEMREVTVIFTDIQSFSTFAAGMSPADLIGVLDRYFSGLTAIVYAHNGMIEKFVGDAAHILFNAPLDLTDHKAKALDCAIALQAFGQAFASDPRTPGFGITRVGIETGTVVVGDVGSDEKLDYTAHGHAMNIAARLEQAGKDLGVTLVAGPALQAALPDRAWQSLGTVDLRSFGKTALWTLPAMR